MQFINVLMVYICSIRSLKNAILIYFFLITYNATIMKKKDLKKL